MENDNNVVIITPELTSMANGLRRTLSGHLVRGFGRSSAWDNDVLLETTADTQTNIRINVFHLREKVQCMWPNSRISIVVVNSFREYC